MIRFTQGLLSAAIGLVLSLAFAWAALAHTRNDSLAAGAAATDSFEVTCFDNGSGEPSSLRLHVLDSSPGALPLVSVHARKDDSLVSASDTVDDDATASPEIYVNGGAGVYTVLVTKTGAGAKLYSLSYHCTTGPDGSGSHTGTLLSVRQNQ